MKKYIATTKKWRFAIGIALAVFVLIICVVLAVVLTKQTQKMTADMFRIGGRTSADSKWWNGEPIWVTATKQGRKSATYFWVGSDAVIKGVHPDYWMPYNGKVPFERRVDQVLSWLEMDPVKRPSFISLYFEEPDKQGHRFGPDSFETNTAIRRVDQMIGRLLQGIKKRHLTECIDIILVSDHGMTNTSCSKVIYLDQFISLKNVTVVGQGAMSLLYVKGNGNITDLIYKLKCKHDNLQVYDRKRVPYRFHYRNSKRIGDLILIPDLGWSILKRTGTCSPYYKGSHGYDDLYADMRSLFIANGPSFKAGLTVTSFSNVEIYNLLSELLDLKPAPNNGTFGSLSFMLKKPAKKRNLQVEYHGGNFTVRCKFPADIKKIRNLTHCPTCFSVYSREEISTFDEHLNLSSSEVSDRLKKNFPWGLPIGGVGNNGCLLTQKYYTIGFSNEHHIPLWAGYKLSAKHLAKSDVKNSSCFRKDPRLMINQTSFCSDLSFYGFKREQLAPSADFKFDKLAMQDTFISSNFVPQTEKFSRYSGLWHRTEELIRNWSVKYDPVYVISGIIFDVDGDANKDNDNMIKSQMKMAVLEMPIPTHFYKIVVKCINKVEDDMIVIPGCKGALEAIAFVLPHNQNFDCKNGDWNKNLLDYTASINDVEKLTGITFFAELPYAFSKRFKSSLPSGIWD